MLRRSVSALHHVATIRKYSTKLEREIARTIRATGPISFAKYMELCLQHHTEGYYARASGSDIVGARGDFVTSPEISQHFGQLIAIWFLSVWQHHTPIPRLRIVELGPGRGTLASDVIQTFRSIPRVHGNLASVDLVETSTSLRDMQKAVLADVASNIPIRWWSTFDDIPNTNDFTVVIAHEFFDALPFHIIEKTTAGWQEVLVDEVSSDVKNAEYLVNSQPTAPRFRYVLSGPSLLATKLATISSRYADATILPGTRIEVSPRGYDLAAKISKFISHDDGGNPAHGAALFVDYGDARFYSNSARAFQRHKLVDVFHEPGQTDLTSNVDFALIREAAHSSVTVHGPINQATFLGRMGLRMRLEQTLAKIQDAVDQTRILKAAGRLIDTGPMGMGRQYQFMGLSTMQPEAEVYPFVQELVPSS